MMRIYLGLGLAILLAFGAIQPVVAGTEIRDALTPVDHIGLYLNPDGTGCETPLTAGESVELQILAVLPNMGSVGITAVTFRVDYLPENGNGGIYTVDWNSDLTIGDIATGIAVAFSPPLYGDVVQLGTITFHSLTDEWLGEDHVLLVNEDPGSNGIVVVNDEFEETNIAGSYFTFNCSAPPLCECDHYYFPNLDQEHIGLYLNNDATGCDFHLGAGESIPVQIVAVLPELGPLGITAVEFRVDGLPENGADGFYSVNWNTPLHIGDIENGIALAFSDPIYDDHIHLGTIIFTAISDTWLSADHLLLVADSFQSQNLVVVNSDFQVIPVAGSYFTFDCSNPSTCECGRYYLAGCDIDPPSLDFGYVPLNSSQTRGFTITNGSSSWISGTIFENCPHYSFAGGGGDYFLLPGESHNVFVTFAPVSHGDHFCTIITDSDICDDVFCTGTTIPPLTICELSTDFIEFGEVEVGSFADADFSITNAGDGLLIGNVSESCPDFSITSGAGSYQLDPGESRDITIRYHPGNEGEHTCFVETASGGENECGPVECHGTAAPGQPICDVDPPALEFDPVEIGSLASASFRLSNAGTGFLSGSVVLEDENFILISGGGPYSLGANEYVDVTVAFQPTTCGPLSATVLLGSPDCADLPCTGWGAPPGGSGDHIGIYGEPTIETCAADLAVGETRVLHLMGVVTCFAENGVTGAEFRIVDLPSAPGGEIVFDWLAETVTGDPATGIQLLFDEAQLGELIPLGTMSITPETAGWVGENHIISVEPTEVTEKRVLFDNGGMEWAVEGNRFTFNCTDPLLCECIDFTSPSCLLTPDLLDFGIVEQGEVVDLPFSISNTGYGVLSGYVSISGPGFSIASGGGSFSLGPGETRDGLARYTYECAGDYEGYLSTNNADCPGIPCVVNARAGQGTRDTPTIGMYSDVDATTCFTDIEPYVAQDVYVYAWLPPQIYGMTATEFRVDNLPDELCAIVTPNWTTTLVIGELGYGISLAWPTPQPGPLVLIGTISFFQIDADCIHDYYEIDIEPALDSGNLVIVDHCFDTIDALGGHFTFNGYGDCFGLVPVTISSFDLEAMPGAARIAWESSDADTEEFRIEAELNGNHWQVEYDRTLPGIYEALDESSHLSEGGAVTYSLNGRLGGEDWMLLSQEVLEVTAIRYVNRLDAPHPNPFNPVVSVPFSLGESERVKVAVYDLAGRLVATLADGVVERGDHVLVWRGRDEGGRSAPSGVYFVRMEARGYSARQKLVLLR